MQYLNSWSQTKYSENEKLTAIKEVLDMPTHNGVTKDKILSAFRWLYELAVEELEPEEAEEQSRSRGEENEYE